jgi:hypothetical protein
MSARINPFDLTTRIGWTPPNSGLTQSYRRYPPLTSAFHAAAAQAISVSARLVKKLVNVEWAATGILG